MSTADPQSRRIRASSLARALVLSTVLTALASPAAQADWSAPQTLVRPPLFDAFRIDGAGNAGGAEAFAWFHTTRAMRRDPKGRGGYLRYVRARTRTAGGSLSAIRTVSRTDVIVDGPLVGIDREATTTVAWQEFRRGDRRPRVMAAVARPGRRFGAPIALGRGSADVDAGFAFVGSHLPSPLVVAADASAVLAWNDGHRIVGVRRAAGRCPSHDRRACFGALKVLSRAAQPIEGPAAAIAADGSAYVAWSDGLARLVSARRGRAFGAPRRVSPIGRPASRVVLAAGAGGNALIAWRGAPADSGIETGLGPVMAAVGDAHGAVSAAQTVDPGQADAVDARTNAQGETILRWRRQGADQEEVLAAVRLPGGLFGAPVRIGSVRGDGELAYRQLAVDGSGRSIIGVGESAVLRPAGASFGAPIGLPGNRQLISAGSRFTTLWTAGGAVRLGDLGPG